MRIDRDKVQREFDAYVQGYDLDDVKIRLKHEHTYQVAEISELIATSLNLPSEEIDLAWLIGMLHDLGRFEQLRQFGTFIDAESIDHAELAVKILFEEQMIRTFVEESDCDEMIRDAIRYHSAYRVPEEVGEKNKLFCDIIRDADKVDIFRVNVQVPLSEIYNIPMEEFYQSAITNEVAEAFFQGDTVLRSLKKTPVDHLISQISLYNGLVFSKSKELVKQQGYMEKMFAFPTENEQTREMLKKMKDRIKKTNSNRELSGDKMEECFEQTDVLRETSAYQISPQKQQGEYTLEDYFAIPDERRVELIDGVIYDMAAPISIHQILVTQIWEKFYQYIKEKKGDCLPIVSPIDVQLDRDEKTMVQPDVIVICDRDRVKRHIFGEPDLVVEILSPSSSKLDNRIKLGKYASAGVREYWIVDAEKRRILVYNFEDGEWPTIYGFDDKIPVHIFPEECEIDFSEIHEYVKFLYEEE